MSYPTLIPISDLQTSLTDGDSWDAVIQITDNMGSNVSTVVDAAIHNHAKLDNRTGQQTLLIPVEGIAGGRLLLAPTGALNRDYDDVRRVYDAAKDAAKRAIQAGITAPLVIVELSSEQDAYKFATDVAYLGMCQAAWQPLEAREALGDIEPMQRIGMAGLSRSAEWLMAVESGRRVARDLCGTEPERMAPPGFAAYCQQVFENSAVSISVIEDDAQIRSEYPLLHAVARASVEVERHRPRVIRLCYEPQGSVTRTLYFAGKGITFDTGGADLKVGGHMAGMSRDKGGAAAVAGFMKTLADLKPEGIKVVAELGAVRNSIGAEAFVPDEIITGHAGKRVRIGNTDAEGRLVLADMLSHMREQAADAVNPEMFSVATLTGHAAIAHGPYTAVVENGPAYAAGTAFAIAAAGDMWADPAEQSRSRREDYDFVQPRTQSDDVLSSNNAPSVSTARGHQFPMAFLSIAAGLDQHGLNSEVPIPYSHIDIAGSGVENGDWQHGKPTAAPVVALAVTYLSEK